MVEVPVPGGLDQPGDRSDEVSDEGVDAVINTTIVLCL